MRRLFILAIAATAGCGNNTTDVDNYIAQLAGETCAWEFKCCTTAEIAQQDGRKYSDMNTCIPYQTLALEANLYLHRLASREGRLKVDTVRARACIAQLDAKACNPKPGDPLPTVDPNAEDPCALVFVGTTKIGDECIYDTECEKGAHCVGDAAAIGRGVCVPWQQQTQICNVDTDCDPKVKGLYCAKADFTCHLPGNENDGCMYTLDAGLRPTLPLLLSCGKNLYCDPDSSLCKRLPGAGDACLSPPPPGVASSCDPDPALNLVCDTSGSTSGNGVCRAPGQVGDNCKTVTCAKDLYCDTSTTGNYTCAALSTLNENCQTTSFRCKAPYFCNTSAGTPYLCAQPAAVGQSCASVPCDSLLGFCDSTSRICKARLSEGATCTSSIQCLSNSCGTSPAGTGEICLSAPIAIQCIGADATH